MKKVLVVLLLFGVFACTPKVKDAVKKTDEVTQVTPATDQAFRTNAPAAAPARKVQMGDYETFKLENGLMVIVVENHKLPRVAYQLFVDIPEIKEGPYAGYIEIAGDLLGRGTTKRSKAEIDEAIDFIGATLNTSGSGMFGRSLTKHSDKLLGIMSEVLLEPDFPKAEFDKIKTQTLSGLAQQKEDPNAISTNVSAVVNYGADHPYGEIITEETVGKITLDRTKAYYDIFFKPNIAYLVVVGDITVDQARENAQNYFGGWKKGSEIKQPAYNQPDPINASRVAFVNKAGAVQSVINITYPVELTPGSPDEIPATVMNTLMGGFFQSRLNQNLRETYGYTYGARSRVSSDRLLGEFAAGASVRNEVTDSALVQFMTELNRMRNEPITQEELDMARNVVSGRFARSLESPNNVARYALNTIRFNLPKDYYTNYLEKVGSVSLDDVQQIAKKYVRPENAHIVVVGNADEVLEKLSAFGEIDQYDVFGVKLEMDESPIDASVTPESIIDRFIKNVGGKNKLMSIKDLKMTLTTTVQGMTIAQDIVTQVPDKMYSVTMMNGNAMSTQILNGDQAQATGGGQSMDLPTDAVEIMQATSGAFPEMYYMKRGYKLELKGKESIDGQEAYRVTVTLPSGTILTDYYSIKSGLKIRQLVPAAGGASQTLDYGDYKEVEGVQMAHTIKITGGMPIPLNMTVEKIELNKGVDASLFEIK